jgi:tetratricopeptide (TPR) repeat protein
MKRLLCAVAPVAVIATPAFAGEEVVYSDAPEWVVPVDIEKAIARNQDIVIYDRQLRLEDGTVTKYTDVAYEIANTQALQRYGTLQFAWLPDKGDLVMHRLQIIRDGEVIDLLEEGVRPEVIRREKQLERRLVDGKLTAVFAIPGMEVGDILRMSSSTTLRDQALMGEVQATEGIVAKPTKLGFGRLRVSWPKNSGIQWRAMGDVEAPEILHEDGYAILEIMQPIAKPAKMPDDAPNRYRVSPRVQFGSFASWTEVAKVMAPHFSTQGTIDPNGEIASEVAQIVKATDDPLERTALALRLVQDEISYLLNGLDGGNYLPQSPEETWELRYGDCKAKSLLLLAMLRQMGIEAEVVLVDSDFGDAVAMSQPVPGAFDHMIVRAVIGGKDYWLDGTSVGTRLNTIDQVPNFVWALPVREKGSRLVAMEPRWPQSDDRHFKITYDMRAGVDFPVKYSVELEAKGPLGAQLRPQSTETDERVLVAHAIKYFKNYIGGIAYDADYSYDETSGIGTIKAKGFINDAFGMERDTASFYIYGATTNWQFNPDRARWAWREIPYALGGPYKVSFDITYLLPEDGKGVQLDGLHELDEIAAGTRFERSIERNGAKITYSDSNSYRPGEIAPEDITQAKADIRRISSGDPVIKFADATRYWEMSDAEVAEKLSQFIEGSGKLVEHFEDEENMYLLRAYLHGAARQYEKALADIDYAIELGANAEAYSSRATLNYILGRYDEALLDAERAFVLQGDLDTASSYAELLAVTGDGDQALEILDGLGLSGDEAVDALAMWSDLSGYAGRQEEAWDRITAMLEERPDDKTLLNAQCWLSGSWDYNLEDVGQVCEDAVSVSGHAPGMIDSRAMYKFRRGDIDGALEDISTALEKQPGLAASRYLRGVILLQQGDKSGKKDIVEAMRIAPQIGLRYAAFGLSAD